MLHTRYKISTSGCDEGRNCTITKPNKSLTYFKCTSTNQIKFLSFLNALQLISYLSLHRRMLRDLRWTSTYPTPCRICWMWTYVLRSPTLWAPRMTWHRWIMHWRPFRPSTTATPATVSHRHRHRFTRTMPMQICWPAARCMPHLQPSGWGHVPTSGQPLITMRMLVPVWIPFLWCR